jgi:hypothetical protein
MQGVAALAALSDADAPRAFASIGTLIGAAEGIADRLRRTVAAGTMGTAVALAHACAQLAHLAVPDAPEGGVDEVRPVPVQMWQGGERSPRADVGRGEPSPV